jgi:hypothetical protein
MFALTMTVLPNVSMAGQFQYFDGPVNYWGKDAKDEVDFNPKQDVTKSKPETSKKEDAANTIAKEKEEFQWNKFLDPNNKEFFREGDYTPPEPFMELVRNPTDQNIRMWFAYMDRKNELASRLSKRMEEYALANGAAIPREAKEKIVHTAKQIPTPADDFERFRFRMYFDSQCPHCKRMFETLNDLQDRGYFVEARQVDNGPLDQIKAHVPVVSAKAGELRQYNVTAVPLLLIGDLKNKKVYRQSGFMTPEQVIAQIREH